MPACVDRAHHVMSGDFRPPAYNLPAVTTPLPDLILYGKPGCHLCDNAHETLVLMLARRVAEGLPSPSLLERNIEDDDALHRRYALTIPVVALGERELELATSPAKLKSFLAEALDGVTGADHPGDAASA